MKNILVNFYSWILDYTYITFWQVKGFIAKTDSSRYLNPQSRHPIPVVIIPGIYEKWHFMTPIAERLYNDGYSIYVIDEIGYNAGTVEAIADKVESFLNKQHIDKCIVVAHSKGGLIAKYLMMKPHSKVVQTVAINTPFNGSRYASLFPYSAIRVFKPTSPLLTQLNDYTLVNERITSIYGVFDPHIPGGSHLEGATNVQLATRGHFRPVGSQVVYGAVVKAARSVSAN